VSSTMPPPLKDESDVREVMRHQAFAEEICTHHPHTVGPRWGRYEAPPTCNHIDPNTSECDGSTSNMEEAPSSLPREAGVLDQSVERFSIPSNKNPMNRWLAKLQPTPKQHEGVAPTSMR
jgi:hypothetical protein